MRGLDKDDERINTVVETMMKQAAKFESMPDLSIKSICTYVQMNIMIYNDSNIC